MTDNEKIVERFSSYICLVDRENSCRTIPSKVCDPVSKSLMEGLLQGQRESGTVDFWARSFFQNILSYLENFNLMFQVDNSKNNIFNQYIYSCFCNRLLFLYLQSICWETALHLSNKMGQFSNKSIDFSIEDYFLIACEASLDFTNLLRSFNFDSSTSLHSFSRIVMQRKVRNQVVKRLKNKTLKFTGYGLLKNTGPNVLEKALLDYGILSKEIPNYKLAYGAFKDYVNQYSVMGIRTETSYASKISVGPSDIKAITNRFNSQVKRLKDTISLANEAQILKYLEICVSAVQDSQSPKTVSLDKLMQDSNDIPASSEFCGISEREWLEKDQSESRDIVLAAFSALEPLGQSSLILWLGLNINQSDFLNVLGVQRQYQVARKFQRYQREMLRAIFRSTSRNISKQEIGDFNALCKEKLGLIKDYLKVYSKQKLSEQAEDGLTRYLNAPDREKLKQWLLTLDISSIRHEKRLELVPIPELIKFEESFKTMIEQITTYPLDKLDSASIQVKTFLISWLVDNLAIL